MREAALVLWLVLVWLVMLVCLALSVERGAPVTARPSAPTSTAVDIKDDAPLVFDMAPVNPNTGIAYVGSCIVVYLRGEEVQRLKIHPEVVKRLAGY